MDDHCFMCDRILDEPCFIICDNHLVETTMNRNRESNGVIFVAIGRRFDGQGYTADDDDVPSVQTFQKISQFEKWLSAMLEVDSDYAFGLHPVLLVYDDYKLTQSDLDILDFMMQQHKPYILYKKTLSHEELDSFRHVKTKWMASKITKLTPPDIVIHVTTNTEEELLPPYLLHQKLKT